MKPSLMISTIKQQEIPFQLPKNWKWFYWEDLIDYYEQGLIRSNNELSDELQYEYLKMNAIGEDGSCSLNDLPRTDATKSEVDRYRIEKGDFFINVRNSKELVGKNTYIRNVNRTILYNHMLVRIKHKYNITGSFINAFLNIPSSKKLIDRCKKGTTTVIALYQKDLYKIPIAVPDPTTYNGIVTFFEKINDKIELNNRINTELEAMAKTIYNYWFVQFDFPDANGKPYKSSGGKMVYNDVLKREVPEGWEVKSLSEFIAKDKNGDWGKEEEEGNYNTKVECIRGTDINGIAGKGEVKAPVRYILEKNKGKILAPFDVVIEISGGSPVQSTGRLAYITKEVLERFENPLICSNFCKAVSLKQENQLFYFVYTWNNAYDAGIFFGFEGKTSGIKNLLFDTLVSHYHVAEPTNDLLNIFQNKVSLFEKQRQKNLQQNQQLSQLRDWLLPMLMNGQVSVADAYQQTAQALSMAAEDAAGYGKKK